MTATLALSGRSLVALRCALLAVGFALAVLLRVAVGDPDVARSTRAGLVFAVALLALALLAGVHVHLSWRALAWGVCGAVLLCAPLLLRSVLWPSPEVAPNGFWTWAAAVTVVVLAEEVFLRGALYEAVSSLAGDAAAVMVGALGFAVLHVPMYGWRSVPLNFVVGVILGELRRATGTPAAPAITHLGADLGAWFLR